MPDAAESLPSAEPSERFITLLNATHARLLGFLRVMLGNNADAEDVLQRASLAIWRKFGEFDPSMDFFAWASSFAFYEAKNFQRIASRSKLHFDDELMNRLAEERVPDLDQREARLAAMDRCIAELDDSSRELVCEFYLDNAEISTLAQRLGRAPQTLYNKLNTLRRLLGDCMRRRMAQEPIMSVEPIDNELHRLFTAKADGSITEEEHQRLSSLLKESTMARAQWFAFQDAEAGMLAWSQREALRRSEPARIDRAQLAAARPQRWRGLRYASAVAAGVVIGALAWALWPQVANHAESLEGVNLVSRDEATTSSVAVLSRGLNMEWDKSLATPALNAPLSPGLLRLKGGVAEIEFFQGARLCVEGPAEIQLVSAGEAFCRYGRFSAHVPPQARGFRLGTPKGDVVDLGTDFGLDLSGDSPELHVFKGEVELHQPQAQMRTLFGGSATTFNPSPDAPPLTANDTAFAFSHNLDERITASQREAFTKWQDTNQRWNDDADLRLRLDFQEGEGARSLHNVATHGGDITAGSVVGCTWAEGRWPGKHALQFRSLSDRVRVSVPGEYKEVTLTAWVQLHSLNVRQSSLCMSQGLASGYMHWQILHDGSLCLGVGVQSNPVVWADYISPVVFTPERLGQWMHLAVVYDLAGREVKFYSDGKRISSHPIKQPMVLTPKLVEIGNWTPSPEKRQQPVRNFIGCMDDFSLVARALRDEEIRVLAQ